MFASSFSIGRTHASYVIGEGLGPHFMQVISAIYKINVNYNFCVFIVTI